MTNRTAPIVAAVRLLLPVLYVGSYLALVTPSGYTLNRGYLGTISYPKHYRFAEPWCEKVFWPMEQIDRRLRPTSWNEDILQLSS